MRFFAAWALWSLGLLCACSAAAAAAHEPVAAPSGVAKATQPVTVTLSEEDFREHNAAHRVVQLTLPVGAQLVVYLGSNPTTGHVWNETALISDPGVVKQLSQRFIRPTQPIPGAGGTAQWVLQTLRPGTTELRWVYAPSWSPQDSTWSLDVQLSVR